MALFGKSAIPIVEARFPVALRFRVRSEEEVRIGVTRWQIEILFERHDTWRCPPNVGLAVRGPYEPLEVERVIVDSYGEVLCLLADLVRPKANLLKFLADFKDRMLEDRWKLVHEGHVTEEGEDLPL